MSDIPSSSSSTSSAAAAAAAAGSGGASRVGVQREKQQQQQQYQQQSSTDADHERLLAQLHGSVMMTKAHASNINEELVTQDGMLVDLSHGMENATAESNRQTRSVIELMQDSKHRSFWLVVFVLVVIIIVLLGM